MPRRPNIIRSTQLNLALPVDIRARLDLHLFSQVENRIPEGAYQTFMVARIKEFFAWKVVDISSALGRVPGTVVLRGSPESCQLVEALALAYQEEPTHG